jgi:PAS domain S-box-containing protein
MDPRDGEDRLLQSVALQNAASILRARQRAEEELLGAKDALHQTNKRITNILESITDGFLVLDYEWRFAYLNPRAGEILQPLRASSEDFIGKNFWDEFPALEDSEFGRHYRRAMEERVPVEFEAFYLPLKSWFEVRGYPSRDGLSIYFQDVTRRKEAEAALSAEKKVLELIAAGAPLLQVLDCLTRETEALSVDGMLCSVLQLDAGRGRLLHGAAPSLPEAYSQAIHGMAIGPRAGSCGTAAFTGRRVVVADIEHDPLWADFRELAGAHGLKACSSTPILSGEGRVLGTIALYYREPRTPGERDERIIATAARLAGIALERDRAAEALRSSKARLSAIFEQAAAGIAIAALDGRLLEMNRRFAEILGYSPEELRERTFAEITFSEDLAATRENVALLLSGQIRDYVLEKRYVRKDGTLVWSHTRVTLLRGEAGEPQQLVGVIEDITPRRQAEEAVRKSELFSRSIVESSRDCIKTLALDGRLLWMSEAGRVALCIPDLGQVIGTSWFDFWDGADREAAIAAVQAAIRGETGKFIGCFGIAGEPRWWNVAITPIVDASGKPETLLAISRDITERIKAEQQIRRSEAQLRLLADSLQEETDVLELLNATGIKLAANLELQALVQAVTDAATKLSGARFGAFFYNTTSDAGDGFMLYTLSGAPREAFERFGQPRATALFGPTFRGEGPIRVDDVRADPRYGKMGPHHGLPKGHLPVRSYLSVPVISRSGEVIGGLFFGHPDPGVFTEKSERLITGIAAQAAVAIDNARLFQTAQKSAEERERLLESERAARTESERASRMKDEFLATLSHELRTPLSSILGWSQLLRGGGRNPADLEKGLDVIERNARTQTQLIEDLLDMSRIISGKVRLDIRQTEPASFIEAAVETVRPAADAKGVRLETVLDSAPCAVSGDPARLQQVVWNLLSNAIKFTPKGGKVQVVLERVNSHVEIGIADTGVGIDPQFIDHVFERFRQADASTTRRFGGLGLGLSIVRHLVELHGGTVHARSDGEGRGSTFTVHLPVAIVARGSAAGRHHPTAPRPVPLEGQPADLTGIKVLVVDDQTDARELLARVLAECNAQVLTAGNAEEALALIESERPDVLVSDIGMPDVDGYELLRRVRALDASRGGKTPAIALTAFARSEDRTRALRAGFLVHVAKPVEPTELIATVASVAGRTAH